jgi:hypothetical protein
MGIQVMSPNREKVPVDVMSGLSAINEGFTEYLAQESVKKAGENVGYSPYAQQLEIVKTMIDRIGIDPFMQAAFTENGIRGLSDALDQAYGEDALRKIAYTAAADMRQIKTGQQKGYEKTIQLLHVDVQEPIAA